MKIKAKYEQGAYALSVDGIVYSGLVLVLTHKGEAPTEIRLFKPSNGSSGVVNTESNEWEMEVTIPPEAEDLITHMLHS